MTQLYKQRCRILKIFSINLSQSNELRITKSNMQWSEKELFESIM